MPRQSEVIVAGNSASVFFCFHGLPRAPFFLLRNRRRITNNNNAASFHPLTYTSFQFILMIEWCSGAVGVSCQIRDIKTLIFTDNGGRKEVANHIPLPIASQCSSGSDQSSTKGKGEELKETKRRRSSRARMGWVRCEWIYGTPC